MQDWDEKVFFTDRKGRMIEISVDEWGPIIESKYGGKTIGKFEFSEYGNTIILDQAHIDNEFQKSGIGTQMLKEFSELTGDWLTPNGRWSPSTDHEIYLSEEGAALLNSCRKKGIITTEQEAPY